MRNASKIHRSLTGLNKGGLRDWIETEKLAYQKYYSQFSPLPKMDFLAYLNEKYPENVTILPVEEAITKIKSIDGDKEKKDSKAVQIKKFFIGMPPYMTYGIGTIAVATIIYVSYRIIKK